jgi:signal transduction histidine kinase
MTDPSALQVLVIDDDAATRANLRDILELDLAHVETAATAAEALDRSDWSRFHAIILDRRLPDGSGDDLLPRLMQLAPLAAVIVVTGYADLEGAIAAIRQGAADYLLKPVNPDLLRSQLARITERRRAEQTIHRLNDDLRKRVAELQTLLDVIPIGIAIAQDPECRRIDINASFARLLGVAPGLNLSATAPPDERLLIRYFRDGREIEAIDLPMQRAARSGQEVHDVDLDVVSPDGRILHLLGHAAPLFQGQGQSRGAVGAFLDMTERKRELEHILQSERLAAIGQMMTGLAHESGNALARSRACLEMLAWELQDRPEAADLIQRILKAQEHLQHLYEEVRGYAAPLKLEKDSWELAAIWRQAWNNLEMVCQGRDAHVRERTTGPCLCVVDSFRLEQVFRNIFENALAACTDPVRIDVTCTTEAEIAGKPAASVTIRDNGPGLTPEQQQRIFEPFFTTKARGTGLGMAIAKRIVEAHGGRIAVGSGAPSGAEIVITLPRESKSG